MRDRHEVRLTECGVYVLDRVAEIWDELEDLRDTVAERFSNAHVIRLTGMLDDLGNYPIASAAEKVMRETDPAASLRLVSYGSAAMEAQIDMMRNGEADCAALYDLRNSASKVEGLAYEHICKVPVDALVASDGRLAGKRVLALHDLDGKKLIRLIGPRYSARWALIRERLSSAGVSYAEKRIAASSPFDSIDSLMSLEDAVFLSPRRSAPTVILQNPSIVAVPFEAGEFELSLDIAYFENAKPPLLDALVDALRVACADAYKFPNMK